MPLLHLLPLGTVIDVKGPTPGWEDIRFMVTSYFPKERGGNEHLDYAVTPWPLGYVNIDDNTRKLFYSCNEEDITTIDFLGAVDESLKNATDDFYERSLLREDMTSPLALGVEPMMHAYGDLPVTVGDLPFGEDEILPLGTVVSTKLNGDQKAMIYQHAHVVKGKRYDYGICAWPQGENVGRDSTVLINQDQITAVHFRGYENALSQELAKRLEKNRRGSLFSRIIGKRR